METKPKQTKVYFDFDRNDIPQIPRVNDVLYAMELSSKVEYYNFCKQNNNTRYLANVGMVIELVGKKVREESLFSSEGAQRIVARAIVDLCPEEATCLFREAYINAKRLAGDKVPPKDVNVHELRRACLCQECRMSSSTD